MPVQSIEGDADGELEGEGVIGSIGLGVGSLVSGSVGLLEGSMLPVGSALGVPVGLLDGSILIVGETVGASVITGSGTAHIDV